MQVVEPQSLAYLSDHLHSLARTSALGNGKTQCLGNGNQSQVSIIKKNSLSKHFISALTSPNERQYLAHSTAPTLEQREAVRY